MNTHLGVFALVICVLLLSIEDALASIPVTVTSVVALGNQSDSHLAPVYPNRDGGAVGSLGGKIVWFWSDTSYIKNHTLVGFYGNTGAVGTPGNPLIFNGPERQAIPFTDTELAFNNAHNYNPRVVLWPKSGVIEISPGKGVLFVPKGYWGNAISGSEPNQGVVACNVTIGTDGQPSVTRLSDVPLWPLATAPAFGSLAAASDSTYIYLYSTDRIATYTATHYVARAPLSKATTLSAYEYFNNKTQRWEPAVPSVNDTTKAFLTSTFGIDGNIYYSKYHETWIMIYNYAADNKVYMRTAPAPQGPWGNDKLIYTPPPPTAPGVGYIYGTTGTNLYDSSGKSSAVDFTWCYSGGYANWVVKVNFA